MISNRHLNRFKQNTENEIEWKNPTGNGGIFYVAIISNDDYMRHT